MLWPAGFGALAMTVKPPPVTAPATTACCKTAFDEKLGTNVAKKVIAALSLNAVNTTEDKNRGKAFNLDKITSNHQPCNVPCVINPAKKNITKRGEVKFKRF